jgi:tRNA-Thr(GGU) m(6)t(6)A37 methyltransferase TsaA
MKLERIGEVRSCFGEKFAAPRQPGLCPAAWGRLVFDPTYRSEEAVRGIDGFSHLWLIFQFHATAHQGWHPTVRPPRLGGNARIGVFASRSTFRPNNLGLSLVRLEGVERTSAAGPELLLGGLDLIDRTPVFDIKPYLPYAESQPHARAAYASEPPPRMPVEVADTARSAFDGLPLRAREVLCQALSLDPRPAAGGEPHRVFGAGLCGTNVRFQIADGRCSIVEIHPAEASGLSE